MDVIRLDVYFYSTVNGTEPVRDWLRSLNTEDKKIIGEDIKTVQFGWPLGMPLVKNLSSGIWEIRSNIGSKKIARTLFFTKTNKMILANAFIKKTQKTPKQELDLALKRMKYFEREYEEIII